MQSLLDGNERFRNGQSKHYQYHPEFISELAKGPKPRAAIVSCIDARVAPEVLFDQPLGTLFVSRVPGNVASDSAKWMLEIAVTDLKVPLLVVLGHTECLAIKGVIESATGSGGSLRMDVSRAVHTAKMRHPQDLFFEAVKENAKQTSELLRAESFAVRQAVNQGELDVVTGIYDVHSGRVELL